MLWVKENLEEVLNTLETNQAEGLSTKQAKERVEKYGFNEFEAEKKETLLQKILHHLLEISAIILLVAAAIAAYMALTTGYGWAKVWVILAVVVINTFLGIWQESRAEAALEALKKLNSHDAVVIRDGKKQKIDAAHLVPGDIIEITAGDMISADARLIEASSLMIDESGLTGESVPVEKDPQAIIAEDSALGDRVNMVYSGSLVTNGRALAVVVETAMETEMGKIARLLNKTAKLQTPLQLRLKKLSINLSVVALLAGALIFAIGVFVHGESLAEMLLVAVALGVAAVPEALPIIVTMIFARGLHNMVLKNTIIRRIPAVETVGNTSVICSDKTGTLTQNKMFIKNIWLAGQEPKSVDEAFTADDIKMVEFLTACSNAEITLEDGKEKIVGDPTEAAIIRLLHDEGLMRKDVENHYPRVHELPFDSTRKLMTTVHQDGDGYISITKGAFDRIPVAFTPELREKSQQVHDEFADKALRVIAIGYRRFDEMPSELTEEYLEHDLTFLGIVGMIDPPRPESAKAVSIAKTAGIKTVMITGDHILTAKAIAREIGIFEEGDRAITGAELVKMTEKELVENVRQISVYARVSPEDKIRIVQAWQSLGEVITMTGDGVNDAPALKAADVGAAMGITGTEVSKNAADMVITDDNFATIVDAIAEGRTSYENIRKTVYFLLSVNFSQIFIMLFGVILGWGPPVVALQLLFINVVSDGIPGLFMSYEKAYEGIMKRQPLKKEAGIFSDGLAQKIAARGTTFVILTLVAFYIGKFVEINANIVPSYEVGVTMAFVVLSWASVVNIFNVRSGEDSIFKVGLLSNPYIFMSALGSMLVTLFVALFQPVGQIFEVVPLSGAHWWMIIGLTAMQIVSVEVVKLFKK